MLAALGALALATNLTRHGKSSSACRTEAGSRLITNAIKMWIAYFPEYLAFEIEHRLNRLVAQERDAAPLDQTPRGFPAVNDG
jgi:hypothetical protein